MYKPVRTFGLGFDLFFELADVRSFVMSWTSALNQFMQGIAGSSVEFQWV
jgi:hypothetical protein